MEPELEGQCLLGEGDLLALAQWAQHESVGEVHAMLLLPVADQ